MQREGGGREGRRVARNGARTRTLARTAAGSLATLATSYILKMRLPEGRSDCRRRRHLHVFCPPPLPFETAAGTREGGGGQMSGRRERRRREGASEGLAGSLAQLMQWPPRCPPPRARPRRPVRLAARIDRRKAEYVLVMSRRSKALLACRLYFITRFHPQRKGPMRCAILYSKATSSFDFAHPPPARPRGGIGF